ncbi:MAG: hypothetical protein JO304_27460, partial [Solirubrobacterales bacterium]|nr:hypothetical protein [Solirubrobacterales bacterium]
LAVTFAKQIGGYFEQPDPPITVASSELTIPYADVWSNDWFVPQSKIHHIWQALTSYSLSPALSVLNLGPAIDNLNSQLDDSGTPFSQAIQVDGSWCVPQVCPLPNGSAASTLFDLSVTVDADNLNLVFSHGALPPQPTGCAFGASSDSPPATIYAECSVNQPSGIQWLALRQEINGTWNILQEVGPGGIIGGPPLGPIMGAPQLGSASTVDVTVCSVNEWGFNCLPPTSFALQVNRVTHDAQTAKEQSGGYYGYGGGGAPPTPPAPACPGGTAAGCIRTKS